MIFVVPDIRQIKHDAACQKGSQLHCIISGIYPEKQIHSKVNKISKGNGYRNLQNVFYLKILSQNQDLQQDQKNTEDDGEISKCGRKFKT